MFGRYTAGTSARTSHLRSCLRSSNGLLVLLSKSPRHVVACTSLLFALLSAAPRFTSRKLSTANAYAFRHHKTTNFSRLTHDITAPPKIRDTPSAARRTSPLQQLPAIISPVTLTVVISSCLTCGYSRTACISIPLIRLLSSFHTA